MADQGNREQATHMSDEAKYLGFAGQRLRWVEHAIAATQEWMKEARGDAFVEIAFTRPGSYDYDSGTDQGLAVKRAAETLKSLEAERKWLLSSDKAISRDLAAGKYEDDFS
jgi:hypothetical protein